MPDMHVMRHIKVRLNSTTPTLKAGDNDAEKRADVTGFDVYGSKKYC